MPPEYDQHETIKNLLKENQRLIIENNQLLRKLNRAAWWGFWLRIVWFVVIIGLPFLVFYYLVEPYFNTFGSSFDTFQEGLQEVPGWRQFYDDIRGGGGAATSSDGN